MSKAKAEELFESLRVRIDGQEINLLRVNDAMMAVIELIEKRTRSRREGLLIATTAFVNVVRLQFPDMGADEAADFVRQAWRELESLSREGDAPSE